MKSYYRDTRKIDPACGAALGDGSPNNQDRIEIGPTQLAMREWEEANLIVPNLRNMREYRWHSRLTQHIVARGYGAGLLMFDPLKYPVCNRFSTNMQLWNTHNPFRAVLLMRRWVHGNLGL